MGLSTRLIQLWELSLPLFWAVGLITEPEGTLAPPWGPGRIPSRFAPCSHLQYFHFPSLSHVPPLGNAGSVSPWVVGHSYGEEHVEMASGMLYIRNQGRAGTRRGRAWRACVFERLGGGADSRTYIWEGPMWGGRGPSWGEWEVSTRKLGTLQGRGRVSNAYLRKQSF